MRLYRKEPPIDFVGGSGVAQWLICRKAFESGLICRNACENKVKSFTGNQRGRHTRFVGPPRGSVGFRGVFGFPAHPVPRRERSAVASRDFAHRFLVPRSPITAFYGPLPKASSTPGPAASAPIEPPDWLSGDALDVYLTTEPLLRAKGRIATEHAVVLAQWASTAAELATLSREIAKEGSTVRGPHGLTVRPAAQHAVKLRASLTTLGKSLGLDPASAARFESLQPPAREPDPFDEFVRSRQE